MALPQAICQASLKRLALVARVARDDEEEPEFDMGLIRSDARDARASLLRFKDKEKSMDLTDWAILTVLCAVFCGIFTVIASWFLCVWIDNQMKTSKWAAMSQAGVDARLKKAERMEMAMAEVAQRLQNKEDMPTVLKETAIKYPDVAMSLAKKMGLNIGL